MKNTPVYNKIGTTYNSTRQADPYIAGRIHSLLAPKSEGLYIDIGCGTGNYYKALSKKGVTLIGVDPSATMLNTAKKNNPEKQFVCSKAEDLPFNDNHFDGGIATFTIHHWDNKAKGIQELSRVMKKGSNFVMLSFTPEQMDHYWLKHYFPMMIKASGELVPSKEDMIDLFLNNGFSHVVTEPYFVHEGLTDHFLFSNKYKPEQYLDPKVRSGASSFRLFVEEDELQNGLKMLEEDINTGKINSIIDEYENDLSDYIFFKATK